MLWRQRKLIIATVAIAVLLALMLAFVIRPVYRAEVLLAPANAESASAQGVLASQLGSLAQFAPPGLLGAPHVSLTDEAIAVLKSRKFMELFLREEHLLLVLFPDQWDAEKGRWLPAEPSLLARIGAFLRLRPCEAPSGPSMWSAYKAFDKLREVNREKETGLVRIAVERTDPVYAAEWANKLVRRLNAESRQRALSESQANIRYPTEQADKSTHVDMRRLLFNLIEGEMKKTMLANSKKEFSFRIIDPAVVPQEKARPRRAMIIGIFLGLMFGIDFAFFRNIM